ncbi:MAG: 50S ribosomal protein L24 [Candidatus Saccharimonadales bacterium]|jgi:large subunit ribosomal protein L24
MRSKQHVANKGKLRIHKGDTVKVIAGAHKGKTGLVVRTSAKDQEVFVDGIGVVKRKVKPSQVNPRGTTKEIHVGLAAGKVALVIDDKKTVTSRVTYKTDKSGTKVRIAKKTGKEA